MRARSGRAAAPDSSPRGGGRPARRRRRLALGAAWLGVVGAVAFAASVAAGGAEARPGRCAAPSQLSPGGRKVPLILKVPDTEKIVLHFDDSRRQNVSTARLEASPALVSSDLNGLDKLTVSTGDAQIRKDGDHYIALDPSDGLSAMLVPLDQKTLELCAIVNPHKVGSLVPGTYSGTLLVTQGLGGPQLATIPVQLSFRASHWKGIGIAFAAVVLGLLVKVLSDAAMRHRESPELTGRQVLKAYCCELTFPTMLILAAVGGILVFTQMYYANAQWGAHSGDLAKLFAVCFAAQMSGSETLDIIKRTAGRS